MGRTVREHEKLSEQMMIRLTVADMARVKDIAERNGTTPAELGREALLEGLGPVATRMRQVRHQRRKTKQG